MELPTPDPPGQPPQKSNPFVLLVECILKGGIAPALDHLKSEWKVVTQARLVCLCIAGLGFGLAWTFRSNKIESYKSKVAAVEAKLDEMRTSRNEIRQARDQANARVKEAENALEPWKQAAGARNEGKSLQRNIQLILDRIAALDARTAPRSLHPDATPAPSPGSPPRTE